VVVAVSRAASAAGLERSDTLRRIGGRGEIQVDVRHLAATNKDPEDAIKKAEAMKLSHDAKGLIEQAKTLVEEAKKHHTEAKAKIDHANAMWKARAAQAQAEAAAAISTP